MSGKEEHFDVIVIGAGISGLGAAYMLKNKFPFRSFVVLERRNEIGGTWSLLKFPGIRSDSDFFTFSYSFHPYKGTDRMPGAKQIMNYLEDMIYTNDLKKYIKFNQEVSYLNFDSSEGLWHIRTSEGCRYSCDFILACTGYWNQKEWYTPDIPGIEEFRKNPRKKLVHSFDFDEEKIPYEGLDVVVVGSGATAITIIPFIAKKTKSCTMLQRTPSYVAGLPRSNISHMAIITILIVFSWELVVLTSLYIAPWFIYKVILALLVSLQIVVFMGGWPAGLKAFCGTYYWTYALHRWFHTFENWFFYWLSKRIPVFIGNNLIKENVKNMPNLRRHFTPPYKIWQQRFCIAPDDEFRLSVESGATRMVTAHIERFTYDAIKLKPLTKEQASLAKKYGEDPTPKELRPDLVVLATGFKLAFGGGIQFHVDGKKVDISKSIYYRGFMLHNVPNMAFFFGYLRNAWTLRVELTMEQVYRVLRHYWASNAGRVVPHWQDGRRCDGGLNLMSGYIKRGIDKFPSGGGKSPWVSTIGSFFQDWLMVRRWDVTSDDSLIFSKTR